MKKIKATLVLLLFTKLISAQGETDYWYFGNGAGLYFGNGNPIALSNSASTYIWEGCSVISSPDGNLLFYTDGNNVWNSSHQIMTNGSGLWGGIQTSTTQAALIIPQPESNNIFYVFTVDTQAGYFGGNGGISYSIVDMNMEGGLGAVMDKNISLLTPTAEKVTAVHHSNGKDIWVLTQHWGSNAKYAWLMTSNGLNSTPIISNVGAIHYIDGFKSSFATGCMKFSPDGTKLASVIEQEDFAEIFDFNNNTGIVSNPITLFSVSKIYGLEFSPDGNRLYGARPSNSRIYQWDVTLESENDINNSRALIFEDLMSYGSSALQLGIDGRIYVALFGLDSMDVIQNPNELGVECNYTRSSISLEDKSCNYGLPNFIQSYFNGATTEIINPVSFLSTVSVYPNPFHEKISISFQNQNSNQAVFEIRNILGQSIINRSEVLNITNELKTVDLSFLSKGVYLLAVNIGIERSVLKIVKE